MVQTFLVRSQAKSGDKWREVSMEKGDFRSAATMFVLFINDMPEVVTSCIEMFADDARVFI